MTYSRDVRLQKYIAMSGYCSRRKAEELIAAGSVSVNGLVVNKLGTKVNPSDTVTIDGQTISLDTQPVYYLLNKPKAVLSSVGDDRNRSSVVDLIATQQRIFPVGRLDKDTTGALILTNDGLFAYHMTHPKHHISKSYRVSVKGRLTDAIRAKLHEATVIDGVSYHPVQTENVTYRSDKNTTQLDIILHEGKNRQIRKMMDFFNLPAVKLHRFAIGSLQLDGLSIGSYRLLEPAEIDGLMNSAQGDQ